MDFDQFDLLLVIYSKLRYWTLAIDDRKAAVTVAYIDFKRAFDSMSYAKLLTTLQSYSISGVLLSWIKNFLHCRTQ